jgi:large subunit ribosomal protein L21
VGIYSLEEREFYGHALVNKKVYICRPKIRSMYAIVEIAGQQFKVQQDQQLFVHRLESDINTSLQFDKVLLVDNGGKITVGAPVISGASVSAKVIEHLKGDRVIVFKKKRRKGYQKSNGHRQQFTKIQIENIKL